MSSLPRPFDTARIPRVDAVGIEERAAALGKRSIKKSAKVVLYDVRKSSPSFGRTQTVVAGGGQGVLVRIPAGVAHGYRPLTNPCSLLYFVTETFDPAAPDEFRIAWDHPAVKELWETPNG